MQRKLCLIDCPQLVDFAFRLGTSVLKVPNRKVKFLGKFNLQMDNSPVSNLSQLQNGCTENSFIEG